jgi:hypothetical protein
VWEWGREGRGGGGAGARHRRLLCAGALAAALGQVPVLPSAARCCPAAAQPPPHPSSRRLSMADLPWALRMLMAFTGYLILPAGRGRTPGGSAGFLGSAWCQLLSACRWALAYGPRILAGKWWRA